MTPIRATSSPRSRRFGLGLAAALVLAALALGLSGCVIVKNVTVSQQNGIGDIRIGMLLCASGASGCGTSNSGVDAPGNNQETTAQVLLGVRATAGARPPAQIRFFDDDGVGPLFVPNPSYTSELQRLAPAPPGEQWFGYTSNAFAINRTAFSSASLLTGFGLPAGPNGGPFAGPFRAQVVVGARGIDATHPVGLPIVCGSSLTSFNSDQGSDGQTVCVDSPTPGEISGSKVIATNDLALRAGAPVTTPAGQTATIGFSAEYAGGAGLTFALASATTIPGAVVSTNPTSLSPGGPGTTAVQAQVAVPAGTPAGTYPVTLTATVSGQTRTATANIVVPAAGGGGAAGGGTLRPLLSGLSASPRTIYNWRGAKPAVISVRTSQAGLVKVVAERQTTGRRKNGRCVAPTAKLRAAGARVCIRYVGKVTLSRAVSAAGVQNVQKVTFSGRAGRRARVAGVWRLTVTGISTGGVPSLPRTTTVTVKAG